MSANDEGYVMNWVVAALRSRAEGRQLCLK